MKGTSIVGVAAIVIAVALFAYQSFHGPTLGFSMLGALTFVCGVAVMWSERDD